MIWVLLAIILGTGDVAGVTFADKKSCEEGRAQLIRELGKPPEGMVLSQCIKVQ